MEYLDHQDWNQIIVTKKNTSNKDPDKSKKKLSESQQKDIKLLKQVEEDNVALMLWHEHSYNELLLSLAGIERNGIPAGVHGFARGVIHHYSIIGGI